jgi:hypothetical protein
VAVVLGAGALYWFSTSTALQGSAESDELAGLEALGTTNPTDATTLEELPEQVATVNGVAISRASFEESIAATEAAFVQQGADVRNPALAEQVFTQALERSINNEVLAQAAADANVTVEAAAIDARFDSIAGQFPDDNTFTEELATAGITREELRADIESQLTLDAYIESTNVLASIEPVTEVEARAFYDQAAASAGQGVPSFAEVQPQIEAQITQQKQQAAVAQLLETLRAEAEIEVLI